MATATPTTHGSSALIAHLGRLTQARSESALDPLGLRPRHLIALTVLRDHGAVTQQGLATALQVDRTNLVGLLNDLESQGLITRVRSAEDRRKHDVELTAGGEKTLAKAEKALAAAEDEVLGALDAEEREALYDLLQRATSAHMVSCVADANATT